MTTVDPTPTPVPPKQQRGLVELPDCPGPCPGTTPLRPDSPEYPDVRPSNDWASVMRQFPPQPIL